MESSNEPQLQLLILSKDLAHMQRMKAMLHAHGIKLSVNSHRYRGVQPDGSRSLWSLRKTIQKPQRFASTVKWLLPLPAIHPLLPPRSMRHCRMSCAGNPWTSPLFPRPAILTPALSRICHLNSSLGRYVGPVRRPGSVSNIEQNSGSDSTGRSGLVEPSGGKLP
jgi:MarR-like DNA-binding transcriptional regulator SgrR of sgrS sRNA